MSFQISVFIVTALLALVSAKDGYFDKIIDHINSGQHTWKARHSHVTEMGHNAFKLAGGLLPSAKERSLLMRPKANHNAIPKEFDARQAWPECPNLWSIKDQGNCGSCWAVSSTSVMSDRVCIASSGRTLVNISAEQLAACCTECGSGCDSGYPYKAWRYFRYHGLVTGGDYHSNEGCQPYEIPPSGSSSNKQLQCVPKKCTNKQYKKSFKKDFHYGKTGYYVYNDVQSIQAEIMTNGPVVATFVMHEDFMSYSKGVYSYKTGKSVGGHCVRILGWGVENGVDYWLIANSWNRTWGENGYVKFIRGKDDCGIEDYVSAGIVDPN